ncbi:MAG TPA: FAD-dependent oxidoreductase [Marmoricola sp.]|nr:FAD-dependent oxidoreductase [Marmoricola sp.]
MSEKWDVIIVGGGSAGLSAALTLGRARRRVLVLDAGEPRNRFAEHMQGLLGHDGLDPAELVRLGRKELEAYDVTLRPGIVESVGDAEGGLSVHLVDGSSTWGRALVVATGLRDELPDIPGIADLWGTDVLHCPYCHGWEVRGRRLAVLGTSALSIHQAQLIRQWSDDLVFFTAEVGDLDDDLRRRLEARAITTIDTPVAELVQIEGRLTAARLADGREIELDAIFTAPTARPNDAFLESLNLDRVDNQMGNFIAVDPTGQTSHSRVWAIGNVVNPGANVPISLGAGSMTGAVVNMALVNEDFDHALLTPAAYWEDQYASSGRRWSGRVNATVADVVRALEVGDALELGCGEGGDAVWLAEHGWLVTAVDISSTAVIRGAAGAAELGVADRVTWVAHDLATWTTAETFDLVTASFFHSTVDLPRTEILRRAAEQVRPGGHLLLVSHVFETDEDVPPWASRHHSERHEGAGQVLLTPSEEIAELALDPDQWIVELEEIRPREATGPDGHQHARVKDGVVLLRRR